MEVATAPASKAFGAPGEPGSARQVMARPSRFGDKAFEWLTCAMALAVVVLVILIGWELWNGSAARHQKIRVPFPCHVHVGPRRRPIWRSPVYIRNAGFFSNCAVDCSSVGHCNGSVSDGACSTLDSAAPSVVDRDVGCNSQCHPWALGHFRNDSMAARLSLCMA